MFPAKGHTLREPSRPRQNFEDVASEVGLRFAYLPLPYLAAEVEGAFLPTAVQSGSPAKIYALRGHGLLQLPTPGVTPFMLFGMSGLFTTGKALGNEGDPGFHFGGGAKLPLGPKVLFRVDVRDTVILTSQNDARHYPELLLGLGVGFGGTPPAPPPKAPLPPLDSDGDGVADPLDGCPAQAAATPTGCPPPDSDSDGVIDEQDQCPTVPSTEPNGCPNPDPDKDGVNAEQDKCPLQAGVAPDGCPDLDVDKDGVALPADQCPDAPETANGFQDDDGCPDELPAKLKQFTGVIQGIEFDFGKSTIRKASFATLDGAAAVLVEFNALRVRVTGHTDNVGAREANVTRSTERANAVKAYLVSKGVAAERIEAVGAGPDKPLTDNKSEGARQKNRRIEFEIIK